MFDFHSPPRIVCRPGAIDRIGAEASSLGFAKPLVVTDRGVADSGILDRLTSSLTDSGASFAVFDEVEPDPSVGTVQRSAELGLASGVDGVIGLGGGSPMDVAKLASKLIIGDQQLEDIYGVENLLGRRLPLIQIPTTAGTGSEVTQVAIVTIDSSEKRGVVSPKLLPDVAVLDANLTASLPSEIAASTGLDAMIHAIEAYTSRHPNNNPLSKMLALQSLSLLSSNILEVVADGANNIRARSAMLLGATLAGQAFANSSVAGIHALAYPLGSVHHVAHGVANGLVMPAVLAFNFDVCQDDYAVLGRAVSPELAGDEDKQAAIKFVKKMAQIRSEIGLPESLRSCGIEQRELETLAEHAMKQSRLLTPNPKRIELVDALQIYKESW